MTSTRSICRDTQRYKAAMAQYVASVVAVLKRYNAEEDPDASYRYILNTPAGRLRVHVADASIFQRFDELEAGRLASAAIAHSCNPNSGKWNFGETDREILASPVEAMGYWERCIDKLMSIPYGWQPFADRLLPTAQASGVLAIADESSRKSRRSRRKAPTPTSET